MTGPTSGASQTTPPPHLYLHSCSVLGSVLSLQMGRRCCSTAHNDVDPSCRLRLLYPDHYLKLNRETQSCRDISHVDDNPKGSGSKDGTENVILLPTVPLFPSSRASKSLRQLPAEAGNEELRRERQKTKQVATGSGNTAVLQ
ncbi:hypothetical protein F2P81_023136 [Scophthalmus maximus]|uniref:Uncharacterized protein n=1 Tax=Scophthalmus maximus TaxID=52904 RepID=A0A6A4S1F6_SCOMX|nr:hypothetical protein F2P81_023136 [Scophthalmus maximus]